MTQKIIKKILTDNLVSFEKFKSHPYGHGYILKTRASIYFLNKNINLAELEEFCYQVIKKPETLDPKYIYLGGN